MTAGVHHADGDLQATAIFEAVHMVRDVIKLPPDLIIIGLAHDEAFPDAPRLIVVTISDHFVFETVVLGIPAGCKNEHAIRDFNGESFRSFAVIFTAGQQLLFVCEVSPLFPQQTKESVKYDLEPRRIFVCLEEFKHDLLPRCPGRHESIQPERPVAFLIGSRV